MPLYGFTGFCHFLLNTTALPATSKIDTDSWSKLAGAHKRNLPQIICPWSRNKCLDFQLSITSHTSDIGFVKRSFHPSPKTVSSAVLFSLLIVSIPAWPKRHQSGQEQSVSRACGSHLCVGLRHLLVQWLVVVDGHLQLLHTRGQPPLAAHATPGFHTGQELKGGQDTWCIFKSYF